MKYRKWVFPASLCVLAAYAVLYAAVGEGWITPRKIALAPQLSTSLTGITPKLLVAAAILGITFALGRWHCTLLCPAGIVQDVFSRIGKRLKLRRLKYVSAPRRTLLLFAVGAASVFGLRAPAQLTDPIGLFGRLAMPFAQAWRYLVHGEGTLPAPGQTLVWAIMLAGVAMLVVLPLFKGRLFCDRFCPVGALLGVAAQAGGKAASILPEHCTACGQCAAACPTQCIDSKGKTVAADRCLGCGECAGVCRFDAIGAPERIREAGGRRTFLGSAVAGAAGVFALSKPVSGMIGWEARTPKVTPPGTGGDTRHRQFCVGCQACVAACPMRIIQVKDDSDLRPVLDYDAGFCHYNCVSCVDSCPAGAFRRIGLEEKQTTRLALVSLATPHCVVFMNGTECGACAEVCPTHAVRMVSQGDGLPSAPDFDPDYCIGCGACYHACPAEPRAFVVRGLGVHERSRGIRPSPPPSAESPDPPRPDPDELTDFPF